MKRWAALLLAVLGLVAAGAAQALMLGPMDVGSFRGEPLLARVALLDAADDEIRDLEVGLGAEEDFARAGVERHDYLVSLEFEVVPEGQGPAHVMVTGRDPIDSPVVTFLIEALWSGGRTIRTYTVLLESAPPQAEAAARAYGPVRKTDTLWSIARRHRSEGISVQRTMLAILALNPHAFTVGNVNALREGAMLEIPSLEPVGSGEQSYAIQEVRRQNELWQTGSASIEASGAGAGSGVPAITGADVDVLVIAEAEVPEDPEPAPEEERGEEGAAGELRDAELRVIVSGAGTSAGAEAQRDLGAELSLALEQADSQRREIYELSARLDEAERLITDLQRLVELKDDDIADLQRQLLTQAEAAARARTEGSAAALAVEAAAEAEEVEGFEEEGTLPAAVQAEIPAEAPASAPVETTVPAEDSLATEGAPEQEEAQHLPADPRAGVEPASIDEAGGIDRADEEEAAPERSAAPPSLLTRLEDLLGFSPVVAGVGLVGVILILGGLLALMRRRRAEREYSDEDDILDEEGDTADLWDDEEAGLDEAGAESRDEEASIRAEDLEAQEAEETFPSPGEESDMDDFEIGIDPDEELRLAFEDECAPDPDVHRDRPARERALPPAGDAGADPSSPRSALESELAARLDIASDQEDEEGADGRGDPPLWDLDDESTIADRERPRASSAPMRDSEAVDGREDSAAFVAREGLAGDVDELQTKLDLAQTYIDMEDFDGARALLREVQANGEIEQRAIARYLAGKLP